MLFTLRETVRRRDPRRIVRVMNELKSTAHDQLTELIDTVMHMNATRETGRLPSPSRVACVNNFLDASTEEALTRVVRVVERDVGAERTPDGIEKYVHTVNK